MRIEWEGIPEGYWPDTEKPWRVAWGFGAHKDFATYDEAFEFYYDMLHEEARKANDKMRMGRDHGWDRMVEKPYDVIEVTAENRNSPGETRKFVLAKGERGWYLREERSWEK